MLILCNIIASKSTNYLVEMPFDREEWEENGHADDTPTLTWDLFCERCLYITLMPLIREAFMVGWVTAEDQELLEILRESGKYILIKGTV